MATETERHDKNLVVLNLGKGKCRQFTGPENAVGIDIWRPYLEPGDILADVRYLPIRENSVDIVYAIELIEHLEKHEGLNLVTELQKIAKVIVMTSPTYYFESEMYDGNPYQLHKSCYSPIDFPDFECIFLGATFLWVWMMSKPT